VSQNPFKNLLEPAGGKSQKNQQPNSAEQDQKDDQESSVPALRDTNEYLVRAIQETHDLTTEQCNQLRDYMKKARTGITLLMAPMICTDKCPFKTVKRCPLELSGIPLPATKPCPVEHSIVRQYRDDLAAALHVDIEGDNLDAFDAKLLNDLAGIMMMKTRAEAEMANKPDTTLEYVAGYTPDGKPMKRIITNPRISLYERMCKLERDLMKELMATRRAKFQATGNPDDASRVGSDLFKKMEAAARRRRKKQERIIEAEFQVKQE
jgi:hypothetical protein